MYYICYKFIIYCNYNKLCVCTTDRVGVGNVMTERFLYSDVENGYGICKALIGLEPSISIVAVCELLSISRGLL